MADRKYQVVTASDATDLAEAVCDEMEKGWQPLGGVSVSSHYKQREVHGKGYTESETVVFYAQAMVLP